ncbi:unnamed protein product [Rotaria sp. Silwood2]|nr:unnamed protein product [Rotaria sp. Silwood2]CAF4285866.1 unnamed protein product [Rotaria sp. Silwood2]
MRSNGLENSAFVLDQQSSRINTRHGIIVTTKLQDIEDEDDDEEEEEEDKNNVGFEKLSGEGHRIGLFVLKIRQRIIKLIEKEKTLAIFGLKLIFIIGFIIYFGFAMSNRYGTSAFPIRGNIFRGNSGSKHPHRIRWTTIFYSFVIQFLLAAIVIRSEFGFQFFEFLGKEVSKFMHNADSGAVFVFGKTYQEHFFVFKVSSIIIFLGSVINVLYYLGAMQYVIGKIAWLMQNCLNTTAAESMNAAANIFVGMSEAPLMIMPLIPTMTISELHAVLVGGFSTMSGSILATFIFFGVPANHLIAASVMAAPGALGFAKLLLPETHHSKTTWKTVKNAPLPEQHNVIDALLTGAGHTLKICGFLIANLIAFISVLHFADVTISWFFNLLHHPEINFQFLLGLLFYPFSMIIGIPLCDCLLSSKLIGIKISLNEFIAYQELGKIRQLRNELILNNTFPLYLNGTLTLPNDVPMLWDDSSLVILTYALCGFSNFGSMGIALATLGVFAPTRKRALTKIAPRALIAGSMVSLMTASIAGINIENIYSYYFMRLLFLGLLYDARHVTVPRLNSNSTSV